MSLAEWPWVTQPPGNELTPTLPPTLPHVQTGPHRSAFVLWCGADMLRG